VEVSSTAREGTTFRVALPPSGAEKMAPSEGVLVI
jgi:hypothetical protein